jgi:hypothetical protein
MRPAASSPSVRFVARRSRRVGEQSRTRELLTKGCRLTSGPGEPSQRSSVTVVIAAHNEAAVIGRCLSAFLGEAAPGEFAVLVASNGSTDDTAGAARAAGARLGYPVEVLEIATASKIAALRAAEVVLSNNPTTTRVYLDADVTLTTDALRLLAAALDVKEARVALVGADVDTSECSWLTRSYFVAWAVLARNRSQGAGSGVVAVNPAGAARISSWPDVLSDDAYVVRRFAADERVVVPATAHSFAARTMPALVRRRARVVNGNRQLDALLPGSPDAAGAAARVGELRAARRSGEISTTNLLVYVGVTALARGLALWRRVRGTSQVWSTDASSRRPQSEGEM